jgi:AcrR family transcriptional regulator
MTDRSNPAPLDRRSRRTRAALRSAFVTLVLEKGYEHVTVEDITDAADLARATFYAHYTDKGDLLAAIVDEMSVDLTTRLAQIAPTDSAVVRGEVVLELFTHAAEHRDLYRLTFGGAADGKARRAYVIPLVPRVVENFAARIDAFGSVPPIPPELTAQAFIGMHMALVEWWLTDAPYYTAAQMAAYEMRLFLHGFRWAHGLAEGEVTLDESLLNDA